MLKSWHTQATNSTSTINQRYQRGNNNMTSFKQHLAVQTGTFHPSTISITSDGRVLDRTPHPVTIRRASSVEEMRTITLSSMTPQQRWNTERTSQNGYWQQGGPVPTGRRGGQLVLRRGREVS
jgi:hypothetical protein